MAFPLSSTTRPNSSFDSTNMSVISLHATALEVCNSVYGESETSTPLDAIERFYEASATQVYENPILTATSRSVIADIFKLSRQLSTVDIPRPLAMFYTLFRLRPPNLGFLRRDRNEAPPRDENTPPLHALRVWTDIGDICENESFDGHRKSIIEHTLNILILPGIHSDGNGNHHPQQPSSASLVSTTSPLPDSRCHPTSPSLPIPGTSLSLPSPLHFKLHVITRLSFNEQGRITHHRDFWDVKDVMGLVPGVSLAQWIGTRLAARGLTYAANIWTRGRNLCHGRPAERAVFSSEHDLESAGGVMTPAAAYSASAKNALGLEGL